MNVQTTTKGVFSDNEGNPSSMRIMSFISLLVAIGLAAAPFFIENCPRDNLHVLYFLTAAFAPKAVQKFAERQKS